MMQGNCYSLDREPDAAALALVAQSLSVSKGKASSAHDEVTRLLDFGEKNTPSAVAVARDKYQQLKAAWPQDRRIDYAMSLVLVNQQQYAAAHEALARYLADAQSEPAALCAKMWVEALMQRYSELADDACLLADQFPAADTAPTDDYRQAARFLGVVTSYLDLVQPEAIDAARRADIKARIAKRLGSAYASELRQGQESVATRFNELQSVDQEYEQYLAEVKALGSKSPGGKGSQSKPAPKPVDKDASRETASVDAAVSSFSHYASFPYEQQRQRLVKSFVQ
jgi:hypothetical protein